MYSMKSHKFLLLIIFLPVVFYLLISSLIPYSYTVQKTLQIPESTAVALPSHPTKYVDLQQAVQSNEIFFGDYALSSLLDEIYISTDLKFSDPQLASLHKLLKNNVFFAMQGEKKLSISSTGPDLQVNRTIANFYLGFVLDLVKQGMARAQDSSIQDFQALKENILKSVQNNVQEHKSILTSSRVAGLLIVFLLSLLIYTGVIAIVELSDSSFKSERQAVQYLDMNLVGSIPNLKKIAQSWGSLDRS